ncbi:MAG: 30S ribosome-binding factor RbfA [Gammaproteobacteria bacterium]|nr:30S ribosome-binding factor RbfA [Gammaproteobacteria bacterium]
MPNQNRKKRIEDSIQRELGKLLLNYPRQSILNKVSITAVDVAPDLSMAKVFFSVFEGLDVEAAKNMLQSESKHLRKSLANDVNLRLTPRLNFIHDESIERSRALSDLIDSAIADDEKKHHE